MGQTGSGKTGLAEALANELDAQLINADAFQVYRGLDIGTNKPADVSKYKLLDLVGPEEDFGAGKWVQLALAALEELWAQGRSAVVVGGTGFYVRALMEEFAEIATAPDPGLRSELMRRESECGLENLSNELLSLVPTTKVDLKNPVRVRRALERELSGTQRIAFRLPPFEKLKVAPDPDLGELEEGLKARVSAMWEAGWPEEVTNLVSQGVPITSPGFRAIGYQCLAGYIRGESDRESTEAEIVMKTRQYAKRQRTWLRSEPELHMLPRVRLNDEGQTKALLSAVRLIIRRGDKKETNG